MTLERRVVTAEPENSETPLGDLGSWVTPNRLFFVRNHFDVPEIELSEWRLRVSGLVRKELELDWKTIAKLPQRTVFATMECAGNGRSFLEQQTHGVQWGAGAVGHAEWTGTPVSQLLEAAGVRPDALEVVFAGADKGKEADHPQTMAFARSLPLDKALHPDTLLATRMNGEPLEPAHGWPLRLIVPGWYGVASVKWLSRIQVSDKPFNGYYQTVKYTVERRTGRGVMTEVVGEMLPKSEILKPDHGAELGIGQNLVVGLAWAGPHAVEAVEVSFDGGKSWRRAELVGPRAPYSWTLWEYLWHPEQQGEYEVLSRTISAGGQVQPTRHDPLNGGYHINFSRPVRVEVMPTWGGEAQDVGEEALRRTVAAAAEERSKAPLDIDMTFTGGDGI